MINFNHLKGLQIYAFNLRRTKGEGIVDLTTTGAKVLSVYRYYIDTLLSCPIIILWLYAPYIIKFTYVSSAIYEFI